MARLPLGILITAALAASPVYAADKKCVLQKMGNLPVTMSGTRPLISGTINGTPVRFLLDSGAFFSMVTRESAQKLKLREGPMPPNFIVYGTGGSTRMGLTKAKEFSLAGFSGGHIYNDVQFMVSDNSIGDVDGIIGQNVIGNADTEYDLANGFVRLFRAKDCKGDTVAYWTSNSNVAVMKLDDTTPASPHLIGEAKINGKKIRVLFDTGAWRSILDREAAAKVGIVPENSDVAAGGVSRGLGSRTTENYIARFDSLDLGGELIKNARLRVGDMNLRNGTDMLLGADFFLSHRIYISSTQNKLYFTYNGGPVFDLRPSSSSDTVVANTQTTTNSAAAEPIAATDAVANSEANLDAASLRRRGAASAGRNDFPSAIADFEQAIKLDPNDAETYYERGNAYWRSRQPRLASSDFDQALKLKPDHLGALVARGTLRLAARNNAGARADFDEAIRLDPTDRGTQLRIAETYAGYGLHAEATELLTAWIDANPKDDRLPTALNQRCYSRAMVGKELDLALADCNLALKKGPRNSQVLDSRAFAYLRVGDYDKSIADYKAVLKLQPKKALSMYGLGLAEIKKGMKDAGEKDLQAAVALAPNVAEFYKRLGLTP